MIVFPTPFLSRSSVYRGVWNYMAMASDFSIIGGVVVANHDIRISGDGLNYERRAPGGDMLSFARADTGGAFQVVGILRMGSLIFAYGRIWDVADNARCGLFVSTDKGKTFNRLATAVDGIAGASGIRGFVDAVIFGSNAVFLSSTGELAYTSDGIDVSTRANPGFTGTGQVANTIAAGTGFLIAGGVNGQAFSVATPGGTATARNLQFGTSSIEKLRAGNVMVAAGSGKISTASLTDPAAWTARTDPVGGPFDYLSYNVTKWFAGGLTDKWLESANGATWASAETKPINNNRVRSGILETGRLLLFISGGKLAVTSDFSTWNTNAGSGLAARDYQAVKLT
ncbi:hypothetical protein [Rhizobium rhizoryzae]|uniref:hypothetical protein n=1 Tax=Rhizobium rhizoryzae TaxID=451876 RepID=UPI002899A6C5|nr:hypothetical protein [Rhizobium rhizoryzae]